MKSKPIYIDSSVIVADLFGQVQFERLRDDGIEIYSSELCEVEIFRAIERARLTNQLTDWSTALKTKEAGQWLESIYIIPFSREIIVLARHTFGVPVRALDALHVASAQWLSREQQTELLFCTHDQQQKRAAMSRGLEVVG